MEFVCVKYALGDWHYYHKPLLLDTTTKLPKSDTTQKLKSDTLLKSDTTEK